MKTLKIDSEAGTELRVPAGELDDWAKKKAGELDRALQETLGKRADPPPAPPLEKTEGARMGELLHEAVQLVNGDRNHDYGKPTDNHRRTAQLWTAYVQMKYPEAPTFTAEDVCWLNVLQKMARNVNRQKRDNFVDAAGWSANAYVCGADTP